MSAQSAPAGRVGTLGRPRDEHLASAIGLDADGGNLSGAIGALGHDLELLSLAMSAGGAEVYQDEVREGLLRLAARARCLAETAQCTEAEDAGWVEPTRGKRGSR
jgi:hypothetical protein